MELDSEFYSRTKMLIGKSGVEALCRARVLLVGLGGVGGYALEALVRAGIGHITVVDCDVFCASNLNRQVLATLPDIGRKKTDVALERIRSINPECDAEAMFVSYGADTADGIDLAKYDYVIDAIDTVSAKLELALRAQRACVPIISCLGTGNKLGVAFEVADINDTSVCPLARVMRRELKKRGVQSLKVVYSKEPPIKPNVMVDDGRTPGSVSYAPAIAGLLLASEVIKYFVDGAGKR